MPTTLPLVSDCSVSACSYNQNGCAANAMNMSSDGCSTFIALPEVGGGSNAGRVGACQKADCTHNDHLECTADSVQVGGAAGECLTYAPAA